MNRSKTWVLAATIAKTTVAKATVAKATIAKAAIAKATVAAVAVLLASSGCARTIDWDAMPAAPEADYANGPYGDDCDAASADPPAQDPRRLLEGPATEPVPADAVLVSATRCIVELERVPGDGEWSVRVEQEATTGLDELAVALRAPSESSRPNQLCPAIGYLPIVITLTDATGRQFHPTIPTTACGAPLKVATDAIAALPWTTVARTRIAQVRTELVVSSGCPSEYKAMVALFAAEGDAGAIRHPVDSTPRPLRVCRFTVTPDAAVAASRGQLSGGTLVAASTLDADAAHELLTALDAAPDPTTRCAVPSSFVVLDEGNGYSLDIMIEVDGCYRALVGGDIRQLDRDLVTRLLG